MRVKSKYSILEEKYPEVLKGIDSLISKAKLKDRVQSISTNEDDAELLNKAYEVVEFEIIKLWDKQTEKEFTLFCSIFLDISTLLPLPVDKYDRVVFIFKAIALGYLGEGWQIARRFLIENEDEILKQNISDIWNERLIDKIFQSLFFTIRKKNWHDLKIASMSIEDLRKEQATFEEKYINSVTEENKKAIALEIGSLYHLGKFVELLSVYLIDGTPNDIKEQLELHLEYGQKYSEKSGNLELNLIFQYFRPFAIKIISNSIWTVAKRVNNRVTSYVKHITKSNKPIFELLYPQREAILGQGLLDLAHKAVVVNLPTSSGKTVIAEFRILQALNQSSDQNGWVVYTVPTKALVNQIALTLQRDLGVAPLSLKIEKLSGALELDAYEEALLSSTEKKFDILVTTYEKLHMLVRQGIEEKLSNRPLSLVVVDEAHNIEEKTRGIGLELLLSTIKKDCSSANFLLLTPEIKNSAEVAKWLDEESSKSISIGLDWWQPNERVVGAVYPKGERRKIKTFFKPLLTVKNTIAFNQDILVNDFQNAEYSFSQLKNNKSNLGAIISSKLQSNETVLVIADSPTSCANIADKINNILSDDFVKKSEVQLVKKFVATELGEEFPLVKYLDKGLGLHSTALPEEIRFLVEDLMSSGKLRIMVATTTIAQGINFPVSTIIMTSYNYRDKTGTYKMPTKDFWNLVGRAGRMDQKSLGLVGITLSEQRLSSELADLSNYLQSAATDLASVLVKMVTDAMQVGDDFKLSQFFYRPEWSSFLQYLLHLFKQADDLKKFVAEIELTLRRTFGFNQLNENQKQFITEKVKEYATSMKKNYASLSDMTGFSMETIRQTIAQLKSEGFSQEDWNGKLLFTQQNNTLRKLIGIMLNAPEIKDQLSDIEVAGETITKSTLAKLISEWVSGKEIKEIAKKHFGGDGEDEIGKCTRAIYSRLVNSASWGLAALQKLPENGLNIDKLSEEEKRTFLNLPSMIYYGVNTDEAVLLRKQNVPRMVAANLGNELKNKFGNEYFKKSSSEIINWLNSLSSSNWQSALPKGKPITGEEYKAVWKKLAGID